MKTKSVAPVYRLDAERVGQEAACSLGDERLEKRMLKTVVVAHGTTEFDFAIGKRGRGGLQRCSQ